ncbi:testis-expressed sequence 2 protein-like isoform X1 [Clarias magur]|uniref:Testis-expressed sequence 2 protein-like isoform X1 n=1 Tax=Clarias magur TaxID=1594786 RepID=A0A8J4X5D3_CLAMG|nr:testis-expressed sequence 2 protein-like isoform X1 [Clarias magur]
MTSQGGSNVDTPSHLPSSSSSFLRPSSGPKLHVQRSLSRDTITIHFSSHGKEEEEEDEDLYKLATSTSGLDVDDQGIVTALEASEELLFEGTGTGSGVPPVSSAMTSYSAVTHTQSSALAIQPLITSLGSSSLYSSASSSWPSEHWTQIPPPATYSASSTSSPVKSSAVHSKPFLSLVRSLSTEVEPREATAAQPMRHRHLMKTLVKSLSTDTARPEQEILSHRPPDSRRNLHLFKPFTQPRVTPSASGDSKTAPSSPIASPDGRSFFKVQEVEARIEDTKRRLSEVMCEPLQLLSKIIGDEGGSTASGVSVTGTAWGVQHPKSLSSSASELCSLTALNGHLESKTDYCIKEEDDLEADSPPGVATNVQVIHKSPSLGLDRCFMSALARQEDEEFCELYSEDFELCTDTEADGEPGMSAPLQRGSTACSEEPTEGGEEEEEEDEEEVPPTIPHNGLLLLISVVYGYFVLPLPTYVGGVLLGVAAGFMIAILLVWLSAPRGSSWGHRFRRCKRERWNGVPLDIKEPVVYKGWMNEIYSYDPETYHATLTHSVYVRLEGSVLRLSKPNRNIPRRATFSEPKPDVTYISQKIYDLTNSKIYLVPHNLARKRVWNKKYPICIELAKQDDFMSKGDQPEAEEEKGLAPSERTEGVQGSEETKRPTDPVLYLFGRTGREKEEWFRRMLLASRLKAEIRKPSVLLASCLPSHTSGSSQAGALSHSCSSSQGSLDDVMQSKPRQKDFRQKLLDYNVYMAKYINHSSGSPNPSPLHSNDSSPRSVTKFPAGSGTEAESEAWVNALLGRIFWDFLREKYWADMVSKKIQMKLSKIRLPYFMNELTLTELDMGMAIPKILKASEPSVDHQGLWFDLEISYTGSFLMTLETKMNLARLGKEGETFGEQGKEGPRVYCLADSDEESSSAGSSDEEDTAEIPEMLGTEGFVGGHRPSKIMRFVDKIAKSKYFQKATETEFIKKKMEEMSNTPLLLTVEVQECQGTLAINIPPPPTDRIWYGFRRPPHLELKARPKLGEREVTFAHVTDWIEKKLDQEFQKIFVMPNMDDVWLPIMHSAMDTRSSVNLATVTTDALKDAAPLDLEQTEDDF